MDPTITADLEAPKDPGALKAQPSVTDNEILGKLLELYTYNPFNIWQRFKRVFSFVCLDFGHSVNFLVFRRFHK